MFFLFLLTSHSLRDRVTCDPDLGVLGKGSFHSLLSNYTLSPRVGIQHLFIVKNSE